MAEDIHRRRIPPPAAPAPAEGNPILPRWTLGLEAAAVPLTSVCSDWEREQEGGNPRTAGEPQPGPWGVLAKVEGREV